MAVIKVETDIALSIFYLLTIVSVGIGYPIGQLRPTLSLVSQ
jgi:hypothetical protein